MLTEKQAWGLLAKSFAHLEYAVDKYDNPLSAPLSQEENVCNQGICAALTKLYLYRDLISKDLYGKMRNKLAQDLDDDRIWMTPNNYSDYFCYWRKGTISRDDAKQALGMRAIYCALQAEMS